MRQDQFKSQNFFEKDIVWCQKAHSVLSGKLPEAIDEEHEGQILRGLIGYSQRLTFISYTIGDDFEQLTKYAELLIEDIVLYLKKSDDGFGDDDGIEWYINCLWYLSFCYFFNIPKEKVKHIADHISWAGKDWLIDRLIVASIPGHSIAVDKLAFPEVYKPLTEALSFDQTTENRTEKIQLFLEKYYPLLRRYDVTWYNDHKEKDPEYCNHSGYWIFELAALSADIGWDDSAFRDHPMYPKDLVDWKFSQRSKDKQIKI
jgi:hypothetical protein